MTPSKAVSQLYTWPRRVLCFIVIFFSESPFNIRSILDDSRSLTGVLAENPWLLATDSTILRYHVLDVPDLFHGDMAPSERDKSLLGITNWGSTSSLYPSPVQILQAP